MIRVLHLLKHVNGAGGPRSTVTLAKALARAGVCENRIVSLLPGTPGGLEMASLAGLHVLESPGEADLRREIEAADVVQLHWWNDPVLYGLLRSDLPPARLLVFVHVAGDTPPHVLLRQVVDVADFCVAGSVYAHGCPAFQSLPAAERAHKTAAVTAAADFARLAGLERQPHAGFHVGYVGTVDFRKMHPAFVRMSAQVRVPGVRFIVCGNGQVDLFKRQASEMGAADRFDFRGYVEDLRPVLGELDVFGYPLASNPGAELAMQEAMYAGVPPVVFPLGGLRDAVIHGETGLAVTTEEEYVAAIEHLYIHPEERLRLGAGARAFAQRHFGAERSAPKLAAVYEEMMRRPKRRRIWPGSGLGSSGAELWLESLGEAAAEPFRASLAAVGGDPEAEEAIAASSPLMRLVLGCYAAHYPADRHLRFWHGLALERAGEPAVLESAAKDRTRDGASRV